MASIMADTGATQRAASAGDAGSSGASQSRTGNGAGAGEQRPASSGGMARASATTSSTTGSRPVVSTPVRRSASAGALGRRGGNAARSRADSADGRRRPRSTQRDDSGRVKLRSERMWKRRRSMVRRRSLVLDSVTASYPDTDYLPDGGADAGGSAADVVSVGSDDESKRKPKYKPPVWTPDPGDVGEGWNHLHPQKQGLRKGFGAAPPRREGAVKYDPEFAAIFAKLGKPYRGEGVAGAEDSSDSSAPTMVMDSTNKLRAAASAVAATTPVRSRTRSDASVSDAGASVPRSSTLRSAGTRQSDGRTRPRTAGPSTASDERGSPGFSPMRSSRRPSAGLSLVSTHSDEHPRQTHSSSDTRVDPRQWADDGKIRAFPRWLLSRPDFKEISSAEINAVVARRKDAEVFLKKQCAIDTEAEGNTFFHGPKRSHRVRRGGILDPSRSLASAIATRTKEAGVTVHTLGLDKMNSFHLSQMRGEVWEKTDGASKQTLLSSDDAASKNLARKVLSRMTQHRSDLDFSEAERFLQRAFVVRAKAFGLKHKDTLAARTNLLKCYIAQNKADNARAVRDDVIAHIAELERILKDFDAAERKKANTARMKQFAADVGHQRAEELHNTTESLLLRRAPRRPPDGKPVDEDVIEEPAFQGVVEDDRTRHFLSLKGITGDLPTETMVFPASTRAGRKLEKQLEAEARERAAEERRKAREADPFGVGAAVNSVSVRSTDGVEIRKRPKSAAPALRPQPVHGLLPPELMDRLADKDTPGGMAVEFREKHPKDVHGRLPVSAYRTDAAASLQLSNFERAADSARAGLARDGADGALRAMFRASLGKLAEYPRAMDFRASVKLRVDEDTILGEQLTVDYEYQHATDPEKRHTPLDWVGLFRVLPHHARKGPPTAAEVEAEATAKAAAALAPTLRAAFGIDAAPKELPPPENIAPPTDGAGSGADDGASATEGSQDGPPRPRSSSAAQGGSSAPRGRAGSNAKESQAAAEAHRAALEANRHLLDSRDQAPTEVPKPLTADDVLVKGDAKLNFGDRPIEYGHEEILVGWTLVPAKNKGQLFMTGLPASVGHFRVRYFVHGSQCQLGEAVDTWARHVEVDLETPATCVVGEQLPVGYTMHYRAGNHSPWDWAGLFVLPPGDDGGSARSRAASSANAEWASADEEDEEDGKRDFDTPYEVGKPVEVVRLPRENDGQVVFMNHPVYPGTYQVRLFVKQDANTCVGKSAPIECQLPFRSWESPWNLCRELRIYLGGSLASSAAERAAIARLAVPHLRDLAENRCVSLVVVDMRSGLETKSDLNLEDIAQNCLQEIEDCRPNVTLMLGQHYGWVPPALNMATTHAFPFLRHHINRELPTVSIDTYRRLFREHSVRSENKVSMYNLLQEFLRGGSEQLERNIAFEPDPREPDVHHGTFARASLLELEVVSAMRLPQLDAEAKKSSGQHGYIYSRHPSLQTNLLHPPRKLEKLQPDGRQSDAALLELRELVVSRGFRQRTGYSTTNELVDWFVADVAAQLEVMFPRQSVPRPQLRWVLHSGAFARSRRLITVVSKQWVDTMQRMSTFITQPDAPRPLCIYGDPGCGKTALVATWMGLIFHRSRPRGGTGKKSTEFKKAASRLRGAMKLGPLTALFGGDSSPAASSPGTASTASSSSRPTTASPTKKTGIAGKLRRAGSVRRKATVTSTPKGLAALQAGASSRSLGGGKAGGLAAAAASAASAKKSLPKGLPGLTLNPNQGGFTSLVQQYGSRDDDEESPRLSLEGADWWRPDMERRTPGSRSRSMTFGSNDSDTVPKHTYLGRADDVDAHRDKTFESCPVAPCFFTGTVNDRKIVLVGVHVGEGGMSNLAAALVRDVCHALGQAVPACAPIAETLSESLTKAKGGSHVEDSFAACLVEAAKHTRVVLVLDGVEKLADTMRGPLDPQEAQKAPFWWLPRDLPQDVHVIITVSRNTAAFDVVHAFGWEREGRELHSPCSLVAQEITHRALRKSGGGVEWGANHGLAFRYLLDFPVSASTLREITAEPTWDDRLFAAGKSSVDDDSASASSGGSSATGAGGAGSADGAGKAEPERPPVPTTPAEAATLQRTLELARLGQAPKKWEVDNDSDDPRTRKFAVDQVAEMAGESLRDILATWLGSFPVSPLWLRFAHARLLLCETIGEVSEVARSIATCTERDIARGILVWLEDRYPQALDALSLIRLSRRGLQENELIDLLGGARVRPRERRGSVFERPNTKLRADGTVDYDELYGPTRALQSGFYGRGDVIAAASGTAAQAAAAAVAQQAALGNTAPGHLESKKVLHVVNSRHTLQAGLAMPHIDFDSTEWGQVRRILLSCFVVRARGLWCIDSVEVATVIDEVLLPTRELMQPWLQKLVGYFWIQSAGVRKAEELPAGLSVLWRWMSESGTPAKARAGGIRDPMPASRPETPRVGGGGLRIEPPPRLLRSKSIRQQPRRPAGRRASTLMSGGISVFTAFALERKKLTERLVQAFLDVELLTEMEAAGGEVRDSLIRGIKLLRPEVSTSAVVVHCRLSFESWHGIVGYQRSPYYQFARNGNIDPDFAPPKLGVTIAEGKDGPTMDLKEKAGLAQVPIFRKKKEIKYVKVTTGQYDSLRYNGSRQLMHMASVFDEVGAAQAAIITSETSVLLNFGMKTWDKLVTLIIGLAADVVEAPSMVYSMKKTINVRPDATRKSAPKGSLVANKAFVNRQLALMAHLYTKRMRAEHAAARKQADTRAGRRRRFVPKTGNEISAPACMAKLEGIDTIAKFLEPYIGSYDADLQYCQKAFRDGRKLLGHRWRKELAAEQRKMMATGLHHGGAHSGSGAPMMP